MDHRNIVRKLSIYHDKIVTIKSIVNRAGTSSEVKEKIEKFRSHAKSLFEICPCRCPTFDDCFCASKNKVPVQVQVFLMDQRSTRLMRISSFLRSRPIITSQVRRIPDINYKYTLTNLYHTIKIYNYNT